MGEGMLRTRISVNTWEQDKLKNLEQIPRKWMTMHGTLHTKSHVHRIYIPRENGGGAVISCEMCIKIGEDGIGCMACKEWCNTINLMISY